ARPAQLHQAEDEQREGDDVADVDEVAVLEEGGREHAHAASLSSSSSGGASSISSCLAGARPLNISSIRSVTRKPPTTLIVPKAIAMTRSTLFSVPPPERPRTSSPPR